MMVPRPDNRYHTLMCRPPGVSSAWGPTEGREEEEGRRSREEDANATREDIFLIKFLDQTAERLIKARYGEGKNLSEQKTNIASQRHHPGKEGTTLLN